MELIEIHPSEYPQMVSQLADLDWHLCTQSVLAKNTPGEIFSQGIHSPISVVWNRMDAVYILVTDAATPLSPLQFLISSQLAPDLATRGIPVLNLTIHPSSFAQPVMALFADMNPRITPRLAFRSDAIDMPKFNAPAPWVIQQIDNQLLSKTNYSNHAGMLGWIQSFWHTTEDFIDRGIGFCAVNGEMIGSWCVSVFAAGETYEFGVATAPPYRGQGLATATASACLQACLSDGYIAHWQCDQANYASVAVAEKLGFRFYREYNNVTLRIG